MKRLDAMDGMLAQRLAEIATKKKKAPPRPRKTPARVERDISPESASSQTNGICGMEQQFRIQG